MNRLLSAKQLTIRYFSIIAIAIIAVHYFVFELTTDDLEYTFAQNRLDSIHQLLQSKYKAKLKAKENFKLDESSSVFLNFQDLPNIFPKTNSLKYNQAIEVQNEASLQAYYVMRVKTAKNQQAHDALIVIDNRLYELSEEQLLSMHTKQVLITVIFILLSLIVVTHISRRLALPISTFSKALSAQNPADLNVLALPKAARTKELEDMIKTFNHYQSHIQTLLERERSFNRYASHELRSPLMVIKGAITLLNESNDKAFIARQLQRLETATDEMSEFVETLLSLTKAQNKEELTMTLVDQALIHKVIKNHTHLIQNKPVSWEIDVQEAQSILIPEAAFHILLGNLIKNAFAYTDKGTVTIKLSDQQLQVIDTGKGFEAEKTEGYGLGLLLVRDISQRYSYEFDLKNNQDRGTIATIKF